MKVLIESRKDRLVVGGNDGEETNSFEKFLVINQTGQHLKRFKKQSLLGSHTYLERVLIVSNLFLNTLFFKILRFLLVELKEKHLTQ